MTVAPQSRRRLRLWAAASLLGGAVLVAASAFIASKPSMLGALALKNSPFDGVTPEAQGSDTLSETSPNGGSPPAASKSGDETTSAAVPRVDALLSIVNPNLLDVAVHPDGNAVIAVGTEGTLLRSEDDGRTYEPCRLGTREYLTRVLVESTTGSVLVIGSGGTALRSIDRGRHFDAIDLGESGVLTDIVQSRRDGTVAIVGEGGTVRLSRDAGAKFNRENTGTTSALTEIVATSKQGRFIAAGDAGVVVVRDAPGRWRRVDIPSRAFVTALECLPDDSVIAAFGDGLVLRSEDEGDSFHVVHRGSPSDYVLAIDSDRGGDTLLLRTRNRPGLLSTDHGRTFEAQGENWPASITALLWVNDRGFWGTTVAGSVVKSDPSARSFAHGRRSNAGRAHAIAQNPRTGTLIAVGASGFMGRSRFDAEAIEIVRPDLGGLLRALAWDPHRDVLLGVGLDRTIVRSTDGGRSYGRVPISLLPNAELSAAIFEPRSNAFIVATTTGSVLRATDGGKTFLPSAELGSPVFELIQSGRGEVLALTESGVWNSRDGGRSFSSDKASSPVSLRSARVIDDDIVVAVGEAGAIHRRTNPRGHFVPIASPVTSTLRFVGVDPTTRRVFVVGDHGTVLVSEDRGEHFVSVVVPTEENLFVLAVSDDGKWLYVGGNAGMLLRSSDGGKRFDAVPTDSRQPIRALLFDPIAREFVVGGVGGLLMRTRGLFTPERISGRFEGRFDELFYHAPSRSVIVAGDRLMRLAPR
ncbi:MAG: YCF48-related protein [Polyangiaceae bacterium]